MKRTTILIAMAVAAVVIATSFTLIHASNELHVPHEKHLVSAKKEASAKRLQISFRKNKLIEVAFLSIKEGKQQQLSEEYFAQVMPIAQEYGMKPLGKIKVEYTYSNFVKPQIIGFFEWPSEEKRAAFTKDPRFLKIRGIRNDALSSLRLSYMKVDEDTEVEFESGKLVELFGMWFDPIEGHRMQTYFKNVMPLITGRGNKYDVQFPVQFTPVNFGPDSYVPQSFGLAIWKDKASNDAFFASKDYAKIRADKDAALAHLDVWHGEIVIQ